MSLNLKYAFQYSITRMIIKNYKILMVYQSEFPIIQKKGCKLGPKKARIGLIFINSLMTRRIILLVKDINM